MGELAEKLQKYHAEKKKLFLGQYPKINLRIGELEEYYQTLINFDFISLKVISSDYGVEALIGDYSLIDDSGILENIKENKKLDLEQIKILKLIQGALQLSAHILNQDYTQLVGQLWGRLQSFPQSDIQKILADAQKSQSQSLRFRPITATLLAPGGSLLRTLSGHKSRVKAVAITSDGKKALSGSGDNTLKLWDLESRMEIFTLSGHKGEIIAVAITPDGKKAVSGSIDNIFFGSGDNTLKLWDLANGQEICTFIGESSICCCAVSPDGLTIVAGESSGVVHFLCLEGGNHTTNE